jgi:hypothetical protein
MPSPFSNGAQNADKAYSKFANGDVTFFTMALTTLQTVATAAHGLSAAPDFVLASHTNVGAVATSGGIGWSATATTLTVTSNDTLASGTLTVFAANIS